MNLFYYVSDQMSGNPSRKLAFVFCCLIQYYYQPFLILLTLVQVVPAGSLQVVPASYQTELVITIPLSAFQRNFTS